MRRRRLTRREKRSRRKKAIIISTLCLLFVMTAGYAAFQTNLSITAKGNIKKNPITAEELKALAVTNGDGLYVDIYEEGRYIYKGANPNNYITYNNETWRIMSVESDGTIKIIRNESIGNMEWDVAGTRDSTTSTYCTNASSSGCNAWAATKNLVGTPSEFTLYSPNGNPTSDSVKRTGTVVIDSYINTYLNNDYYTRLNTEAQSYVVSHNFNVGSPGSTSDTEDIATDVAQEALYKWNGKIGLMNVTEILRTTTNTACTSLNIGFNSHSKSVCSENNWLWTSTSEWTLSPGVAWGGCYVWYVLSNGNVDGIIASDNYGVRPVLYLKSDIKLLGTGESYNPYTIVA